MDVDGPGSVVCFAGDFDDGLILREYITAMNMRQLEEYTLQAGALGATSSYFTDRA